MEEEIVRKAQLKGFTVDLHQIKLSDEEIYLFAQKSYTIVKDFSSLNYHQHQNLGLTDHLLTNIERNFKVKGKTTEKEFSRFLSMLAAHRQAGEVTLYRQMFQFNINIKTAQLFIHYFLEVFELNQYLYANKSRLFQHIKLDTLKAKEISGKLLKKDMSKNVFSQLFLRHMEEHNTDLHKIRADIVGEYLIQAYFHNKIAGSENGNTDENVLLNWNSTDPNTFEIQVVKNENGDQQTNIELKTNVEFPSMKILEQINADFTKKQNPDRGVPNIAPVSQTPRIKSKVNLSRICHDYVLNRHSPVHSNHNPNAEEEYSETADLQLNNELEKLRSELEKRKTETEMEKNVWRLVLNNSKNAIKNYGELKKEITITEGLTDALLNIVDKNSEEWKTLYEIKNNDVEELHKYKFLIAALLEHCSQDLDRDIEGFKFGHDEPLQKFNKVVVKGNFDLNEYLTYVYRTNKLFATQVIVNDQFEVGKKAEAGLQDTYVQKNDLPIFAFQFPEKKKSGSSKVTDKPTSYKDIGKNGKFTVEQSRILGQESCTDDKADKEKEQEAIQKLIENQDVDKLRKHLNKLKRELVFAPKKEEKKLENLGKTNQNSTVSKTRDSNEKGIEGTGVGRNSPKSSSRKSPNVKSGIGIGSRSEKTQKKSKVVISKF